jgi:probable biosynthetic protein (TIGR04099 family)
MQEALSPFILLGMPHLTPLGLSETWLMKELGHRHWMLLALRLGMTNADFRSPGGREIYASICATALEESGSGLRQAKANDIVEIRSSLSLLMRNRHASRHLVSVGDSLLCAVELVSVFVSRATADDNHALARVEHPHDAANSSEQNQLVMTASLMRRRASAKAADTGRPYRHGASFTFTPDTVQDFNGAGLLYFANFQGIFSRAIKALTGQSELTKQRTIFFFGNIRPGEALNVHIDPSPEDGDLLCDMHRPDGKIIATFRAEQQR